MDDRLTGLVLQATGVTLVGLLLFALNRSIKRPSLRYWTAGWLTLGIGLAALWVSHNLQEGHPVLQWLYAFASLAYGYLLVAGCRAFASGRLLGSRDWWLLPVAAYAAALVVALEQQSFHLSLIFQATLMVGLYAAAFHALAPARRSGQHGTALKVMSMAVVLLAIQFFSYVPTLGYGVAVRGLEPARYLRYSSVLDLIVQVVLAFGMVMLVTDSVRREMEDAQREPAAARDRLEVLARRDPLTEALNRHAFYSLVEGRRDQTHDTAAGCVAIIDIDGLKHVNDTYGHHAGDVAIRTVAGTVRSLIRATDLLFRWGGDEFVVLLYGLPADEATRRLDSLDSLLSESHLPGAPAPVPLSVSFGVAVLSGDLPLDQAIQRADADMYRRRQLARKESSQVGAQL
jgi:diguanylate cyclase (GGDEF)-like protein